MKWMYLRLRRQHGLYGLFKAYLQCAEAQSSYCFWGSIASILSVWFIVQSQAYLVFLIASSQHTEAQYTEDTRSFIASMFCMGHTSVTSISGELDHKLTAV